MWLIPPSISSRFAPASACSMKEFALLCPKRGLFVTSSGKPMLREFSWRGWATRRWSQHLFGADVLRISEAGSGVEQWTASLRDSHASRGLLLDVSSEKPTSDGYGQRSLESSTSPKPPRFSLRMSQVSLWDSDSIAYSETLPRSGSMRSGVLSPQPTWEPPISANEFSFWPWTRAEDAESCGNHPATSHSGDSLTGVTRTWKTPHGFSAGNGPDGNEFSTQVRLWQTPASDSFRSRGGDRADEMGLDQQARMFWPTPTEDNANNCGGPSRSREDGFSDLTVAVSTWPTARARDGKGSPGVLVRKDGKSRLDQLDVMAERGFSLPVQPIPDGQPSSPESPISRRRLNPAFAAWLMGMPWWWTSIGPISFARSEMESWRSQQRSLLQSLVGGSSHE